MTNRYCPLCKRETIATYGKGYKDLVCQNENHFFSERIEFDGVVSIAKIRITDKDENFYLKNYYLENKAEVWKIDNFLKYGDRFVVDSIIRLRSYDSKNILHKIKTLLLV